MVLRIEGLLEPRLAVYGGSIAAAIDPVPAPRLPGVEAVVVGSWGVRRRDVLGGRSVVVVNVQPLVLDMKDVLGGSGREEDGGVDGIDRVGFERRWCGLRGRRGRCEEPARVTLLPDDGESLAA